LGEDCNKGTTLANEGLVITLTRARHAVPRCKGEAALRIIERLSAVVAFNPKLFLQRRYPEVQHCASDDFIDRQQRCGANDVGHRVPPIRRNALAGYWRLPELDLHEGELGHKDNIRICGRHDM
jgi:hypothetical protein